MFNLGKSKKFKTLEKRIDQCLNYLEVQTTLFILHGVKGIKTKFKEEKKLNLP